MKKLILLLFLAICPLFADPAPISVVVVGGGPAGLATAIEASKQGAHVTIVEKREVYTRRQTLFLLGDAIDLLEQWEVNIPELKIAELGELKVGVVPIHSLEEGLKKRVVALGVKTIHAEFKRIENKTAVLCAQDNEKLLPYDILIAADGVHSRTRKELGISISSFGKAVGMWTSIPFSVPQEFSISEPIAKDSFFIRKISFGPLSIVFAQTSAKDRISSQEFEKIVHECGWKKEAEKMAEGSAKISDPFEIVLQQANSFIKEDRCAIIVGDAAASASFFQGLGANTALKTAHLAGNFFKQLKSNKENAYSCFNNEMKTETDFLIEDSSFLFRNAENNLTK
jgi:2-polyprenyl-6-methoxyphenol hydroxylase-like FAD-dependent oxidoreductase